MLDYAERRVRVRIVIGAILIPLVFSAIFLYVFFQHSSARIVESAVRRARAVCDTADSLTLKRQSSLAGNVYHGYTRSNRPAADIRARRPVIVAIPDVCHAEQIRGNTESELKILRFNIANEDDRTNQYNQKMLELIQTQQIEEYYEIDRSNSILRYLRPVKVGKACLDCHGDPGSSRKLWVNSKGESLELKGRKSGWAEGKVCAAYEVSESLAVEEKKLGQVMANAGIVLVAGLTVYAVLFLWLLMWAVSQAGDSRTLPERSDGGDINCTGKLDEYQTEISQADRESKSEQRFEKCDSR